MLKQALMAASLAMLIAGGATAADLDKRQPNVAEGKAIRLAPNQAPSKQDLDRARARAKEHDRGDGRGSDRDRDHDGGDRRRDDDRRDHDRRDDDRRDDWDRDDDRRSHDWRRDDDRRRHDWRRDDWRRDGDWRRRGWHYSGWRNDGWRYYRWHDSRHWRYVPPVRYSLDFGYRSGYELAWRDWLSHGRYDRYWRRRSFYGFDAGYRIGYEAGWRDAAFYYSRGYRPDYWAYDPHGGWYFSFRIAG